MGNSLHSLLDSDFDGSYHQLGDLGENPFIDRCTFSIVNDGSGSEPLLISFICSGGGDNVFRNLVFISANKYSHYLCLQCNRTHCTHIDQFGKVLEDLEARDPPILVMCLDAFKFQPPGWVPVQSPHRDSGFLPRSRERIDPEYRGGAIADRSSGNLGKKML